MTGLVAALALAGCGATDTPTSDTPPIADAPGASLTVAVVSYPLAFLTERIGGEDVTVLFLAPPDVDPASWQPDADTIARIQNSDLILDHGPGYAGWMTTATLPASRVVDTSTAFAEQLIEAEGVVTHSHGPEGEHAHGGTAFTTWLDPQLLTARAAAVRDALAARRPDAADRFATRYQELETELEALDARHEEVLARTADRPLLFSHPSYPYLIRRYALTGYTVDLPTDATPDGDALAEVTELAADLDATVLVWEHEPQEALRAALLEGGVRSVVVALAANRPAEGDLLSVLSANAERLAAALD